MQPLCRTVPSVPRLFSCRTAPAKRLYASSVSFLNEPLSDFSAGTAGAADTSPQSVQVTTLENGLKVASLETFSPNSRLGLFINGSSRHETPSTLGITHFLRNAAFLDLRHHMDKVLWTRKAQQVHIKFQPSDDTNDNRSGFRIARELEHNGASLEATCNRENLIYSSECLRDRMGVVIENLADIVNKPLFNPWELDGAISHLKLELAMKEMQPQISLVEELHRVAFRRTLGNSLYCLPHRTGKFTPDVLAKHAAEIYVGQRMALVGVGVDHSQLVDQAKAAFSFLPKGDPTPAETTKYHGGEVMSFKSGPLVHAICATEGASLGSKDLLAFSVYQKLLGITPYIKWGSNIATNRLMKAATELNVGGFTTAAFNASYSDGGLFGFCVVADASNVGKVLKSAVGQFTKASKGDISDQEVTRAKNQMKANLLMSSESQETIFEDIGAQVIMKGSYTSALEVANAVDSITKNDILAVAKRVTSGKPSLSAAGDVSTMPGLDELF